MKQKLLLIRYGGYGDMLFFVPVLKYLFEKYDIHLDTDARGWELFKDDPRFIGKTMFKNDEMMKQANYNPNIIPMEVISKRKEDLIEKIKPDRVIDLFHTLESVCVSEKWQQIYHEDIEERRKEFGDKCWYKPAFDKCGIEFPKDVDLTGLYYSKENYEMVEKWRESHKDQFVVIIPVKGSGFHKKYPFMEDLILSILNKYEDAVVYAVGDKNNSIKIKNKRLYASMGHAPFKQMALMVKYADLVVGPETGLQVVAGMWGTPKIQLCNMSSMKQLIKHHKNDYSVQSKCKCSPCHKLVSKSSECDSIAVFDYGLHASCALQFDRDEIVANIEKVYEKKGSYANA